MERISGWGNFGRRFHRGDLVVRINEYFGPVARDGKTFDQMQVYLENRDKVLTSNGNPQRAPDTFAENIRRMRERKLTFEEAIRTAPGFDITTDRAFTACTANSTSNSNRSRSRERGWREIKSVKTMAGQAIAINAHTPSESQATEGLRQLLFDLGVEPSMTESATIFQSGGRHMRFVQAQAV